jgi:hypothetical protein
MKNLVETAARTEPEITAPVDLCDSRGNLDPAATGFSRVPLHRCNLRGHLLRKKRWHYWAITNDRYILSATIADVDYIGLGSVYLIDLEHGRMTERTVIRPLGGPRMPETVHADTYFRNRRLSLAIQDDGAAVRIRAKSPAFGGAPMRADINITRPAGHESLNVVIPWSRDRFQFTSKQSALPASGTVRMGNETVTFEPGNSWAVLDYGRGAWPYRTFWNWGAGSGVTGGHTIGLNLGGGWTDGTGMTENGLILDGRLNKIHEDLQWDYDTADYMRPWRVTSDRVDLRLDPIFERVTKTDLLLIRTEVRQIFGRYSGRVTADDGQEVSVDGVLGWVEQQDARW